MTTSDPKAALYNLLESYKRMKKAGAVRIQQAVAAVEEAERATPKPTTPGSGVEETEAPTEA